MTLALTQHFANWGTELDYSDIPSDVVKVARHAIFDVLGVIAVGGVHPVVQSLQKIFGADSGSCSAIGSSQTLSATAAAMINGTAAHVWDFDDTSYTGIMHGTAVIFPTTLAIAQETGASEDELIAAFVVGSEVAYTLADMCTHSHYFSGWWSTTTFGLAGATASASYLYKLNADQFSNAIGMAAAAASGGKSVFGTDAKSILVGEAARRAVDFAKLAATGLTGPITGFEDPRGYFALLNNGKVVQEEAETLGKRWKLLDPGLLFKTSPVCSAAHAAIDQLGQLIASESVKVDNILLIEAKVPDLVYISLVYDQPKTPQQAQFSLPYALACTLLHGCVRLEDLDPAEVVSSEKQALMKKVRVIKSEELSSSEMRAHSPEGTMIVLTLMDGKILEGFCGQAYGMPERPLTKEDRVKKFNSCMKFGKLLKRQEEPAYNNLFNLIEDVFSMR